jgi:outer membrane protein assembly complex protein YaeT
VRARHENLLRVKEIGRTKWHSAGFITSGAFCPFDEMASFPEPGRGVLLRARAAGWMIAAVCFLPLLAQAWQSPLAKQSASQHLPSSALGDQTPQPTAPFGPISPFLGLPVSEIRFRGVPEREKDHLRQLVPQKMDKPLDREVVRESLNALYATGLFADLQVEAEKAPDNQVILTFVAVNNYFVGSLNVDPDPGRPSANQIISATKFQLGEVFTPEKLERAQKNILQLMAGNGFYRATVTHDEHPHPDTDQMDITFHINTGPPATVGVITVKGPAGYSKGQIEDIARMHSGDRVTADRVTNALQRIRKKYLKHKRLLAQVSIADRVYLSETNRVDYTFLIDPGPTVEIEVEGFKIRQSVLRKRVPVYEENALDDDLLNEGRRNLLDYMQTRGYFDAKVGVKKQSQPTTNTLRAIYVIDPGDRHKLVKVIYNGNKYFDQEALRSRMQVQPAARFLSHGRYSQSLLASDINGLQELYRANGFRQVQIKSAVEDNFEGKERQLAIRLQIEEGPQTLVGDLKVVGNQKVPSDELLSKIDTAQGQPYSDYKLAGDRDTILNYYFNNGFPNANIEVATLPVVGTADRIDVTFTIQEGEQFFVDQVLVSGLVHTRPYIVQRKLKVTPGSPLSQDDMLRTQAALYDLGIFNQVDTAVQNPNGADPTKNVLIDTHEAKRYTFNYGLGLEFQTGQPSNSANVPQGRTGVSPRVSLEVTRLNFRGVNHTITLKGHLGRLQQRALVSYNAPGWLNNGKLTLSFTGFYDNTLDITTFTSKRLEGSVQLHQCFGTADQCATRPPSEMVYAFTYRRVQASNLVISPNLIPVLSQPTRVGGPGFTYIRDRRDNPLESTKGTYTTIDAAVASKYFGSEADFSRILIQNSSYYLFGKHRAASRQFVIARSTRIGVENAFGNTVILEPAQLLTAPSTVDLIPLPERFLSGGGNSHRGFGLNQAGPRDLKTGYPTGGSGLFLNQLELRLPPVDLPFVQDNISFAIFHDMGNVFAKPTDMVDSLFHWRQKNANLCLNEATYTQCDFNYISHAIGLGVHYKTPIGPVRFDFGYNLNPPAFPRFAIINLVNGVPSQFDPQRASHFNFFFSIGQSF